MCFCAIPLPKMARNLFDFGSLLFCQVNKVVWGLLTLASYDYFPVERLLFEITYKQVVLLKIQNVLDKTLQILHCPSLPSNTSHRESVGLQD